MEENKVNKKKVKRIIVLLLILTVTFVGLGIYAWARYISMEVSPSTAPIAKWHFEIKNALTGQSIETSPINLVTTEYNHVAEHKIAPGTEGEFEVIFYFLLLKITTPPTIKPTTATNPPKTFHTNGTLSDRCMKLPLTLYFNDGESNSR